jgi:hypothetical protein
VRRIILEHEPLGPRRAQLPAYSEVSHDVIAAKAAEWDAAKAALNEAKRTEVELEQTRAQAEQADAEACEQARHEGKPDPKRTRVAAHDRKLDSARHEHRVAVIAEDRAFNALQSALDEHLDAWLTEVSAEVESLDERWQEAVDSVSKLHAERAHAVRVARMIGSEHQAVAVVPLERRQLAGIELMNGSPTTAHVAVEHMLGGLQALGVPPEPEPEPERQKPVRTQGLAESHGGAQREMQERRRFNEHMASPEGEAERAAARERRRVRRARLERGGEEAADAQG